MSRDVALLLGLVACAAAWLLLHLALVLRIVASRRVSPWLRGLSVVPLLTPIVGFMSAQRALSVLWLGAGLVYCVLWRLS